MNHAVHGLAKETNGPAVPLPRRRLATRVLVPFGVIAAAGGLLVYAARDVLRPARAVAAVPVVLRVVEAGTGAADDEVVVQAPGWLEPDPHPFFVTALTEGTVQEVLALEGQTVRAGDVVARLIDVDARLARDRAAAEARDKHASVQAAAADLEAAKVTAVELIERTAARDGARAALAEVEAEHARLEAEIAAAAARAAAARDELARKAKLVDTKAVAAGEVERLRLRLEAEAADHAAAVAGRPVLAARHAAAAANERAAARAFTLRVEETRSLARAEAALASAQAAAALADVALAEADLRLDRTAVKSPIDGVVLRRLVSPGSPVMARDSGEHPLHVVHLYDQKKLQVRVEVPLADAAAVGVDQRAEVVVEALPDRRFAARVTRLVHEADIARNTVQVKVAIEGPDPLLKPEMLARVRLFGGTRTGAAGAPARQRLLAPRAAVRREGGAATAWVVDDHAAGRGRAATRTLTLGPEDGEWIEVRSGLLPGDQVIVNAPADLIAGARVRITEAQ